MRAKLFISVMVVLAASTLLAQTDVIGVHDLSPASSSPVKGTLAGSCLYCHAPHSGLNGTAGVQGTPLWNTKLSNVTTYTMYTATIANTANGSLVLGSDSTLCLSCHDGTVAGSPGATVAYGPIAIGGTMTDILGTDLSTMHPFNFVTPLKCVDSSNNQILQPSLCANPPSTADTTGAVKLINGNVECTTCHNPHVQNTDPNNPNFLVINNTSGNLCSACHSTIPTGSGMGLANVAASTRITGASVRGQTGNANPLGEWSTSIHATASNHVETLPRNLAGSRFVGIGGLRPSLGSYGTVARNGCASCHTSHSAQGNSLLRGADDQTCLNCHNGSSNVSPPAPNILAEMVAPKNGHLLSEGNSPHRPQESALLNQNRHANCVDCHNPHAANRVTNFPAPPDIRASQDGVVGISATDGVTVVNPAINQYENCLRCHGTSTGKQAKSSFGYLPIRAVAAGDPLNVIAEFSPTATSSHPVMHDSNSPFPQPSLRPNMLELDGRTPGRSMGTRILCTDCHNSDDNREFGGAGPNGPHGSIFSHILERRYEFSQAPLPGKLITNLFPNPSLSAQGGVNGGPYALCAKCHDLTKLVSNSSFSEHARHINDGFSCSVCHTAHGMGAQSSSISGERLVNFDVNVVAPNGSTPISYNRTTNSCSLICHNQPHQLASSAATAKINRR